MPESIYNWIEFYTAFADELLKYKDRRQELFEKVKDLPGFNSYLYLKKFTESAVDIDPFTLFAIFNRGSDLNRIKALRQIAEDFNIDKKVPSIFAGIPVFHMSASFFLADDLPADEFVPYLWKIFESAIHFADSGEDRTQFIQNYDAVSSHKGIKWNLTMVLYWIRPYSYLNMDEVNRKFLGKTKNLSADFANKINLLKSLPSGEMYLELCTECKKELETGNYRYKTFPELSETAWVDSQHEKPGPVPGKQQYWLYAPGRTAKFWDDYCKKGIMAVGWDEIGDLSQVTTQEEMKAKLGDLYGNEKSHKNDAKTLRQFSSEIKVGDIVFAKKGGRTIIGRGTVKSGYCYKAEGPENFRNIIDVDWAISKNEYDSSVFYAKTLVNISDNQSLIDELESGFNQTAAAYTKKDFLNDVYISEEKYSDIRTQLETKKNIILQGAPGVGKTFMAERLVFSIIGKKSASCVMEIQFHQSYSYEDFVMGFRPRNGQNGLSFDLHEGGFYRFCKKAEADPENQYYFIIDEINRGNVSKIFGELFVLIEKDNRKKPVRLLYRDELFSIPENLYIIGMMNTADRSLAMIDYALRRRFSFIDLEPGFKSQGFAVYQKGLNSKLFDRLIQSIGELNDAIADDDELGKGFCIGHSYFCGLGPDDINSGRLRGIVNYELIPLLNEYWFDSPDKVKMWSERLLKAVGE